MLHLDESANGKDIELHKGDKFKVCLKEFPTTGFRWSLVSNWEPACKALGDAYTHPNIHAVDAEGSHCWQFQAAQAGIANIALVYQRPWEQAGNSSQNFTLSVHVSKIAGVANDLYTG